MLSVDKSKSYRGKSQGRVIESVKRLSRSTEGNRRNEPLGIFSRLPTANEEKLVSLLEENKAEFQMLPKSEVLAAEREREFHRGQHVFERSERARRRAAAAKRRAAAADPNRKPARVTKAFVRMEQRLPAELGSGELRRRVMSLLREHRGFDRSSEAARIAAALPRGVGPSKRALRAAALNPAEALIKLRRARRAHAGGGPLGDSYALKAQGDAELKRQLDEEFGYLRADWRQLSEEHTSHNELRAEMDVPISRHFDLFDVVPPKLRDDPHIRTLHTAIARNWSLTPAQKRWGLKVMVKAWKITHEMDAEQASLAAFGRSQKREVAVEQKVTMTQREIRRQQREAEEERRKKGAGARAKREAERRRAEEQEAIRRGRGGIGGADGEDL